MKSFLQTLLTLVGWVGLYSVACTPKEQLTVENAAAVAQFDQMLVTQCKAEAKIARSIEVFDQCEARLAREFCHESEALRKHWPRCKEVLP